jgi:hypothetical protein
LINNLDDFSVEGNRKPEENKFRRSLQIKFGQISAERKHYEGERDNIYVEETMSELSAEIVGLKALELKQKSHSKSIILTR